MTTLYDLGKQLRAQREAKQLFKTSLATASGVHRNTVSQLESGGGNVELNTLIALCDQLGLDICLVPKEISTFAAADSEHIASAMSNMLARKLARPGNQSQ